MSAFLRTSGAIVVLSLLSGCSATPRLASVGSVTGAIGDNIVDPWERTGQTIATGKPGHSTTGMARATDAR